MTKQRLPNGEIRKRFVALIKLLQLHRNRQLDRDLPPMLANMSEHLAPPARGASSILSEKFGCAATACSALR
jgi:hypothetical protein